MQVRYLPNQDASRRMTTEELRNAFVFERLFVAGKATLVYCETDRTIVGGVVPGGNPIALLPEKKEMAADFFTERREAGIVNIGGRGAVHVDGKSYELDKNDVLYIGRGNKKVEFTSSDSKTPAMFYLVSYPAHTAYPDTLVRHADAEHVTLGSSETANKRTINKYIHTGGVKSCQLVLGVTILEPGSVWNTMPPHTHQRRSEVYLYYDIGTEDVVVHLMGSPQETRSMILRDREAVISPSWSVHCGAGTKNYTFIWAMGGENQEFADMDGFPARFLL